MQYLRNIKRAGIEAPRTSTTINDPRIIGSQP
jgi:hypothetical protein